MDVCLVLHKSGVYNITLEEGRVLVMGNRPPTRGTWAASMSAPLNVGGPVNLVVLSKSVLGFFYMSECIFGV